MDEEFRFHLQMQTEHNVRAGMSPEAARRQAILAFGGVERHRESMRDGRGLRWLDDLARDVHYATRGFARKPGFAITAIVTLGLGIGAGTAVFTVVKAVFLAAPYPGMDRLVVPYQVVPIGPTARRDTMPWSYPEAREIGERLPAFDRSAAFFTLFDETILSGAEGAERVSVQLVTPDFFGLLGGSAAAGRLFGPADSTAGEAHGVAVLSHGLWATRFGSRPEVVGGTIRLNGVPFTVVGVVDAGFRGPGGDADVWLPFQAAPLLSPDMGAMLASPLAIGGPNVVAHLRPGATLAEGGAQVAALARATGELGQGPPGGRGAVEWTGGVVPLARAQVDPVLQSILGLLAAAAAMLLLIVCVNQANLLLARTSAGRPETAIRLALGAGRGRLVRQALAETLLLTVTGSALGILFSLWATRAFVALWPEPSWTIVLLRRSDVLHDRFLGLDWRVLLFSLGLAAVVTLVVGLAPALAATRVDPAARLRGNPPRAGRRRATGRQVLIVSEVALATALLVAAGLTARSLRGLLDQDPGFRSEGVVSFGLNLSQTAGDPAGRAELARALVQRVAAVPGIRGAALDPCMPLEPMSCLFSAGLKVDGRKVAGGPAFVTHWITPEYFRVLGITVRAGRGPSAERHAGPPTAWINETAARRLFGSASPVGRRIDAAPGDTDAEVVGVVADVRESSMDAPPPPAVYLPLERVDGPMKLRLFVRSSAATAAVVRLVRETAHGLDAQIAVSDARTLAEVVRSATAPNRLAAAVLAFFALVAAALAALGIYGVLAFAVTQRTREIGVRMALGASSEQVLRPIIGRGLAMSIVGLGIGGAVAVAGSRALRAFLYGVAPTDSVTFAAVFALVLAVGLLAAWLPARRATRVDPTIALRSE